MRLARWFCTPLLAVVVSGCVGADEPPDRELTGVTWVVQELPGKTPVPQGLRADLEFENATLSGSDGCNSFGGPYTATIEGSIEVGNLASSAMGCPEPIGSFAADYQTAIHDAARFEVNGDSLTLSDHAGDVLVRFEANPDPPR